MWHLQKTENTPLLAEYKQYTRLRELSFIIIALILVGAGAGLYFVYKNIYYTINKMNVNLIIDSSLSQEAIDFDLYERTKKAWDDRLNAKAQEPKKDPFSAATSTSIN